MSNSLIILEKLVLLFCFIFVGFFCYRKGWLSKQGSSEISNIIVNIFNPLLMISTALSGSGSVPSSMLIQNLVLMAVFYGLMILLGPVVARLLRVKGHEKKLVTIMLVFANTAFMGIPLVESLYGAEETFYITFYALGFNLLFYTYAIQVFKRMAGDTTPFSFRSLINPGIVCVVIAMVIVLFNIQLPKMAVSCITYVSDACIPLTMIITGCALAQIDLRKVFTDVRLYVFSFFQLLLIPAAAAFIMHRSGGMGFDSTLVGIFILLYGMPNGSMPVIACESYDVDADLCSRGYALTTLLSLFTIPFVTMFI
ncbi:MAG: AEC family transporter [Eubacteriales bacterium]|nr:AEC family transporter [Eubacteriales bacterium]